MVRILNIHLWVNTCCESTWVLFPANKQVMWENTNQPDPFGSRCWISSQFPQTLLVSYITTVAFPCLVILANSCMLGLVLFKLWGLRRGRGWKMSQENGSRLWKDCVTVLGLSCVLGLPWGLASTTYVSTPGIYVFTILNSLQGQCRRDLHIKYALFMVCWKNSLLFFSQVCSCSCGPWLWSTSLHPTTTPPSETLPPRK